MSASNPQGRFGTFDGVFTPCVLTILGVIMFMRTGFVVGHAGLWLSVVILLVSKAITGLTSLSLSAISTNTEVRGGGVYFMISRALGPDFGGTIGLTLFIAQAVGVSFYVIGFTEALLTSLTPWLGAELAAPQSFVPEILSSCVIIALFYLTFKGADVVIKVQNYVLVTLLVAVGSFIIGGLSQFDQATYEMAKGSSFSGNMSFWVAFAIFFPATTGITAGANMSGDLKNPERSIPWGTLLAILFTFFIYLLQIALMAGAQPRESLKEMPFLALQSMSLWGPLILLGVFAATLSSALGSFLGAPRILQAMGRDGLMRSLLYFAKGEGPSDEPQRATVLTFAIALVVIWAGDLNAVAEVISMFFLIAYGTINLSAFVESRGGNPSFRPKFKFYHWSTALAGAIGCAVAMMKINDTYALLALGISALIYFYLNKKEIETNFGNAKRGYIFKGVRDGLQSLEGTTMDSKNWRPLLLAVSSDPERKKELVQMGAWLEGRRGLYTVLEMDSGHDISSGMLDVFSENESRKIELQKTCKNLGVQAFHEVLVCGDHQNSLMGFLQSHSVGALKPNTALLQTPRHFSDEKSLFWKELEVFSSSKLNLVVSSYKSIDLSKKKKVIDIWWYGPSNGSLMSLLSYIVTLNSQWSGARLRFLQVLERRDVPDEIKKSMEKRLAQARIEGEVHVVPATSDRLEAIKIQSSEADLVFIGMGATDPVEASDSIRSLGAILYELPSTLLVWSNGEANIFV